MDDPKGFWGLWFAVVTRPSRGLAAVSRAGSPLRDGLAALALVLGTYTVILAVFLLRDYPAVGESVLPLTVEEQYAYQIWYQGPLFLVMTAALAWLLKKTPSRDGSSAESYAVIFAQVSFATTVPFALTTMLVEAVIAALVLVGFVTPDAALGWLTGSGEWFASTYQLAGVVWVVALLAITSRLVTGARWHLSVALGLVLSAVYGLPIALFIR